MPGFGLQLLCVTATLMRSYGSSERKLSQIWAIQLSVLRHQPCSVRPLSLKHPKFPDPGVHGAQECSWQHSAWKAGKGMGARGVFRCLWRTLASKPGLQRSVFLRFQYTGLEPSPAYCLLSIEDGGREGGRGCTFLVPSEMSDLQSELLFRRAEHSVVGLGTCSLTRRNLNRLFVADSPPVEEFWTTPKHSTGLSCADRALFWQEMLWVWTSSG